MLDAPDAVLLEQFVRNESEEAFTEIVRRHIGLVHSVARRHTQNAQHAEEITQAVFIILARKAASLGRKTILSGWLYHTARLAAANFQRAEFRRARREQEVFMQSSTHDEPTDSAWRDLEPLLEQAMSKLGTTDRDAIVLRFFENKSLREVGTAMGLEERAAQKRVARGLEKLRAFLTKRGVVLSVTMIAGAVAANSVQAAPGSIVAAVTLAAKTVAPAASTLALVKGTMKMLFWTNMKIAAIAGAGLLFVTGAAVGVNEMTKSRVYETEMVESYRAFPLTWSQDKKMVSGPFLHEARPASKDLWDPGFRIGPSILGWSLGSVVSVDGNSFDYIYMINPLPPSEARWEFALSSKSELSSITKKDLECDYYGFNDPRGPEVFGDNWKSNAIRVTTNQIFFARLITNRSTTYVVSLAKRAVSTNASGAAMARYLVMESPRYVVAEPSANSIVNSQPTVIVDAPAPTAPTNLPPSGDSEAWQQNFNATYKLSDGEVLRYVPPPFIPERLIYYHTEKALANQSKSIPEGPDTLSLKQDETNELHWVGCGFGDTTRSLQKILATENFGFRKFNKFEFQGDTDALNIGLPGDWTIREGTSREAFLAALEPIIYKATGRQIHFEKQTVDRDVIVAHGKMIERPDADELPGQIKIYAEKLQSVGSSFGDVRDFLGVVADDLGMPMVDGTETNQGPYRFRWQNASDADFSKMGERRVDLSKKVLENVSQQTGLTFTHEQQSVSIWVITEKK